MTYLPFALAPVRCKFRLGILLCSQIWCELFVAQILVDFLKQLAEGLVCFFTIKNPSFPDYISKCGFVILASSFLSSRLFQYLFSYDRKWSYVLRHSSKISIPNGYRYVFFFFTHWPQSILSIETFEYWLLINSPLSDWMHASCRHVWWQRSCL